MNTKCVGRMGINTLRRDTCRFTVLLSCGQMSDTMNGKFALVVLFLQNCQPV